MNLSVPIIYSPDRKYRYWFKYRITYTFYDRPCMFILLNPSTNDMHMDRNPTINRCITYAKNNNCDYLYVVNLFAMRAARPECLWDDRAIDPIGPDNDAYIQEAARITRMREGIIVCAWGNAGAYMDRGEQVRGLLEMDCCELFCLKMTKNQQPYHPLHLSTQLPLQQL